MIIILLQNFGVKTAKSQFFEDNKYYIGWDCFWWLYALQEYQKEYKSRCKKI